MNPWDQVSPVAHNLIPPPVGLRLQFSERVNVNPVTISVVGDTVGTRPFQGEFDDHAWQLTMLFDDPLPLDSYTLTVPFGDATSVTGTALDGNADALAGDDFVFQFEPCTVVPYGDVNATGVVDVDDILYMLDGFADPPSFPNADIEPCGGGDGDVDVDDILAILDAFSGIPACEDPCV